MDKSINDKRLLVSEKTINETDKCDKNFTCLEEDGKNLCPIEDCVGGKVHFIKCLDSKPCQYKTFFGDGFVCCCPTRKELYNKYKI